MPTPTELFERAQGKSLAQIAKQGIGAWLLAVSAAAISGVQTVVDLLLLPFEEFVTVGREAIAAFLLDPLQLTDPAIDIVSAELDIFGIVALPVAVVIIIVTFVIVFAAVGLGITSNVIPGLGGVDNPIWAFFFTTAEEEEEDD